SSLPDDAMYVRISQTGPLDWVAGCWAAAVGAPIVAAIPTSTRTALKMLARTNLMDPPRSRCGKYTRTVPGIGFDVRRIRPRRAGAVRCARRAVTRRRGRARRTG